jgi:hypothetical protein
MSSNHRRKKPPVNVRIARSPTPVDQTSVVRAIRVRRTAAGRIGASITHTESRVEEPAGGPTPAPYAAGSQTNTLEGAAGLNIEVDTSHLVQEPEQLDAQADKPQASPVSSTSTVLSAALTSRHSSIAPYKTGFPIAKSISRNSSGTTAARAISPTAAQQSAVRTQDVSSVATVCTATATVKLVWLPGTTTSLFIG